MSVFRRTPSAPAHRARTRAAHRERGRLVLPMLAATLSATVLLSGGIVALETVGASATGSNPLAALENFTVVVEHDAALGLGGGGEIEGSLAAGGDLSFRNYNLNANKDQSPLPVVDGVATQLLVGGTVQYGNDSSKVDLNTGAGLVANTSGLSVSADGRLQKAGSNGYVLKQTSPKQSTVAAWTSANGYSSTFGSTLFDDLRARSAQIAALTAADGVAVVTTPSSASEITVTLTAGTTNVWNIGRTAFAGVNAVNFANGVTPSAGTPLIINVAGTSGTFESARFNGAGEGVGKYVLWNFSGFDALTLGGSTEMYGSVLAPNAALTYDRGNPLRGQIAAKSFSITGNGEIHHYAFTPEVPTTVKTVSPEAPVYTDRCDATTGLRGDFSLTIPSTAGVVYSLTLDGAPVTTEPGRTISIASGTAVLTATAAAGSTLSSSTPWSRTFDPEGADCDRALVEATPAAALTTDRCDPSSGLYGGFAVTVPSTTGIVYALTVGGSPVAFTAGSPTSVAAGQEVVVTATAAAGYVLKGDPEVLRHVFDAEAAGCDRDLPTLALVDPQAGTAAQVCTPGGDWSGFTVLVPATEHVTYTLVVDGRVVPFTTGAPASVPAGTAVLTAAAGTGYALSDPAWSWSRTFAADAEGCAPETDDPQLPTLPLPEEEPPTLPLPEDEPLPSGAVAELPTLALPGTGANVTLWAAGSTGVLALGLILALGAAWRARRG